MKGANPFAPWLEDAESLCGRKEDIRVFSSFADAAASAQTGVLVVNGGPGTGKSTLLRLLRAEAERAGLAAPLVKAEKNEGVLDIIEKIVQEVGFGGGSISVRGRNFESLAAELEKASGSAFGVVVFIDDIDLLRKPAEALGDIIKAAKKGWGKRRVSFVVSSTREYAPESDFVRVLRLGPFGEHEVRELVEKALKKGPPRMGEECLQSMLADSGGNPRLVKTICFSIYDRLRDTEKVITKGHYLAYLPQIMGSLSREWFGRMYQETPASERAVLKALAKQEGGMHVSDIAKKLGKPLGPVTALVGRLRDRGQIIRVDRGKYRVFSRLYARYVAQRNG